MQHQVPLHEIDLLKEPPHLGEMQRLAALANLPVKNLVNTRSQAFKKMQPDLSTLDDHGIADLIQVNPRLLLRPLLVHENTIVLGFKEKLYEEMFK